MKKLILILALTLLTLPANAQELLGPVDTVFTHGGQNFAAFKLDPNWTVLSVEADYGTATVMKNTLVWTHNMFSARMDINISLEFESADGTERFSAVRRFHIIAIDPYATDEIPLALAFGEKARFSIKVLGRSDESKYTYVVESPSGREEVLEGCIVDFTAKEEGFYTIHALYKERYYVILPKLRKEEYPFPMVSRFHIYVTKNKSDLEEVRTYESDSFFDLFDTTIWRVSYPDGY